MIRAAAWIALGAPAAWGYQESPESVAVKGSQARFPSRTTLARGKESVPLRLTGAALRTRLGFGVYAVGSYVQEGTALKEPSDIIRADCAKVLELAFERNVAGSTMYENLAANLRANHPAPEFQEELARLSKFLQAHPATKGSVLRLAYDPGAGLSLTAGDGSVLAYNGPEFARALWGIYFGPRPMDPAIRAALTERIVR
ncbi:MAG: chalcone isomerase family protein [Isosphaeraceae bacterium]